MWWTQQVEKTMLVSRPPQKVPGMGGASKERIAKVSRRMRKIFLQGRNLPAGKECFRSEGTDTDATALVGKGTV